MRKVLMFNNVSLDGYFTDAKGDMSWASPRDPEWKEFASRNATDDGELVFGRVTYELMASYWPSEMAKKNDPDVAKGMTERRKIVFSRTMREATWSSGNTRLLKEDPATEIRAMKRGTGSRLVILGSGTITAQLAEVGLIDEYRMAVIPVAIGAGRTLFEGVKRKINLKLIDARTFSNGIVLLRYAPAP
jgi:dihydrofolate reductase